MTQVTGFPNAVARRLARHARARLRETEVQRRAEAQGAGDKDAFG
jgi:hypothetical protein